MASYILRTLTWNFTEALQPANHLFQFLPELPTRIATTSNFPSFSAVTPGQVLNLWDMTIYDLMTSTGAHTYLNFSVYVCILSLEHNLLLSTNDDNSTLKITDFGFARSLQPRGLVETLCGLPLYMAPEIMQLHKYDAKALLAVDLWSVSAILFQLVTERTPFTRNNQIQLLQNIMKSTKLQFPPDVKDLSSECIDLCRKLL